MSDVNALGITQAIIGAALVMSLSAIAAALKEIAVALKDKK